MLIDTHCHLNFPDYENDLEEVLIRAQKLGVKKIIIPGADLESSKKAVEIAQKYEECFAAVGIHPHEINNGRGVLQYAPTLRDLASQPKVVAIGETGLDFHQVPDFLPITEEIKKQQEELFLTQLQIAHDLNLPVIIHCREAFPEIFKALDKYQCRDAMHCVSTSGVFHCFGGSREDLKRVLEMGFYVGFDGNITYKNADNLRLLVEATPLDRLLLETDAPYLSPEPLRGKRNEPANIHLIYALVAQIKKQPKDFVIREIEANASLLFHL